MGARATVPAPRPPALAGYLASLAASAVSLLAALGFEAAFGVPTFTFLLGGVMVAAWYGGLGPGLAAVATTVVGANLLLVAPTMSLRVADPAAAAVLAAYVGVALLVSHLTERRRAAEAALRAANEGLREAEAQRVRFLNLLAHEMNNPLTPIMVQGQLLQREAPDERQRSSLGVILRNADRLARLVEDLLDVARLQQGRLPLEVERLDLGLLAWETVASYAAAAERDGVELRAEAAPGVEVRGDPRRLGQVLDNLVGNALKFTPRGGSVEVAVGQLGGVATLEVRDTGAGLSAEQIEGLFRPFHQAHGTARGGTGLGLYISRGIVEQHGGTLTCASDGPGRGATFRVGLPLPGAPEGRRGEARAPTAAPKAR